MQTRALPSGSGPQLQLSYSQKRGNEVPPLLPPCPSSSFQLILPVPHDSGVSPSVIPMVTWHHQNCSYRARRSCSAPHASTNKVCSGYCVLCQFGFGL